MKNLFLIDGTSGSGKSDLVHYVVNFRQDVALVPKYTTRDLRDYESRHEHLLDLKFISARDFSKRDLDYVYLYGGQRYGFSKEELKGRLEEFSNVFVIVRNADVVRQLKNEYSYINPVAVFVYTDEDKVKVRLRAEGLDDDQITYRLERTREAFDDYVVNSSIYDEVIINNSDRPTFHRLVDQLLKAYRESPEVENDLIFVLMSFDPGNRALADYYKAMQRAVRKVDPNLRCVNLDDVSPGSPQISETAKEKLRNCRLAIVDLTGNKPNVFYELGYAHGVRRPCVITSHGDTPKMFYPSEYRIIYYENATELEEKLTRHLDGVLGE